MNRWRWWEQGFAAAGDDGDGNVWFKLCDINGRAFTTKLQKHIWHIKKGVMNSADYVSHVWQIHFVTYTVWQTFVS
jgi:hypothetical protein